MKNRAFTAIELMMVAFVSVILIGALIIILTSGRVSYETGDIKIELQQNLRRGMDSMVRELAQTSHTVALIETINNPNDTIKFRLPEDIDGDGTVLNATTGALEWSNQVQFLLVNGQLMKQDLDAGGNPVGDPSPLAADITSVVFTGIPASEPTSVSVALTAAKDTPDGRTITLTLNSQVTFRN